ncbi:MAG: GntR family transcriptional regulator [Burkholderiaceae bacterium]
MTDPASASASKRGESLADGAYGRLREWILDNEWLPGHRALERDLCDVLQMSRTPVREAMVRLRDEGLIDIVPRHGLVVLPVSARLMQEIYQVLSALEVAAAQAVATDPARSDRLDELELATQAMAAALAHDDLPAWAHADERFHERLVAGCGNQTLIETVARFRDRVRRARMMTLRLRPPPHSSTSEHRELLDALRAGDPMRAAELHRAHRARGAAELVPILEALAGQ